MSVQTNSNSKRDNNLQYCKQIKSDVIGFESKQILLYFHKT